MIIINTKNYKRGAELLKLAQLVQQHDLKMIMAVPASDVRYIAGKSALTVFAQHVDYVADDKSTGHVSAQSIRDAGAFGTLLNHSERPISYDILQKTIEQCTRAKLTTVVCADSLQSVKKILPLKPSAIAFEDPALISTGKSITSSKAHDIQKFVALLKGKPILPICGAGISTEGDVQAAYKLGCKGVLIASAIAAKPLSQTESLLETLASLQR